MRFQVQQQDKGDTGDTGDNDDKDDAVEQPVPGSSQVPADQSAATMAATSASLQPAANPNRTEPTATELTATEPTVSEPSLFVTTKDGKAVFGDDGEPLIIFDCTVKNFGLAILKPDIVFFGQDLPEHFYGTVQSPPSLNCRPFSLYSFLEQSL